MDGKLAALAVGIGVLAPLSAAPSAGAWTLRATGTGALVAAGEPGEANTISIGLGDAASVSIGDATASLSGGLPAGCSDAGDGTVSCPVAGVAALSVEAGDGADTVTVDAIGVPASVDGGEDADQLFGGTAADRLDGGPGDDLLDGGDGPDVLDGGPGDDQLYGAAGTDAVAGGDGNDVATGDQGADALDGGSGADDLAGGGEGDALVGAAGADRVAGEEGNDTIDGGPDADALDGGDGADAIDCGEGDDVADGGEGRDAVAGRNGDDVLDASAGGGELDGGDGRDRLTGGEGDDELSGGAGNDALAGAEGADSLAGAEGDDALDGGPGADALAGGPGGDTAAWTFAGGPVTVTLDARADDGEAGEGDQASSDLETIVGGPSDDALRAGGSPTTLLGGPGADRLTGGPAADILDGQDDDDVLDGGSGADRLTGGPGSDLATYASRTRGVRVSLDGIADDGQPGEGDDADATVERVAGGRGADTLTGARDVANALSGGDGNDRIHVYDRDATADELQCGQGFDRASADSFDAVKPDCDTTDRAGRRLVVSIRRLRGSGLRVAVRLGCGASSVGTCTGSLAVTSVGSHARVVGARPLRLRPARTETVRVRIDRARLRSVPRRRDLFVIARLRDWTARRATVVLRLPRPRP